MTNNFKINNRKIGANFYPYIIAEMSGNHNGKIENAYKIIDMAKKCGADAVKLQTYTPDTLTIDSKLPDFQLTDGLWSGNSLYELYSSAYTPWEWHKPLFDFAKKSDITIFSSPFDNTAVDLLEDLNTPAYKIASFEAIDLPLIKYVAQTKKPIIISTGMSSLEEIREAIETALEGGCKNLAILHCVSGYPASAEDYNLKTLIDMQQTFNITVGLSDHTLNNITAISSIALGASIIEKHITLDRNGGGPDDSFSLEQQDLKNLCYSCKTAWEALGEVNYKLKSSEKGSMKFRRSLYIVKDLKVGDLITDENVRSIRPGYGIPPKFKDNIIGKTIKVNAVKGTSLQWNMIK